MDITTVTTKGQVVIPSHLRHRLGIEKGTKVLFLEKDGEIIMKPVNEEDFRQFAGILTGKGKGLRALLKEREREREKENRHS